jgi:hypothetical protein
MKRSDDKKADEAGAKKGGGATAAERPVETATVASVASPAASAGGQWAVASLPPTGTSLAFLRAKLQVWEECPYLLKKEGKGLKYTFASEADLIALVRPALIRAGILITPVRSEVVEDGEFKTSGGSVMRRVLVKQVYRFTHVGSGWYEDVEMHGEGADIGDKAANKAMTDAMKYAVRQWAMIETGDDPDKQSSDLYRRDWDGDREPGEASDEPVVPPNLRESYGKCKDALARATTREQLDTYRDIYRNKRGFPESVVAYLDKLYLEDCDRVAKQAKTTAPAGGGK